VEIPFAGEVSKMPEFGGKVDPCTPNLTHTRWSKNGIQESTPRPNSSIWENPPAGGGSYDLFVCPRKTGLHGNYRPLIVAFSISIYYPNIIQYLLYTYTRSTPTESHRTPIRVAKTASSTRIQSAQECASHSFLLRSAQHVIKTLNFPSEYKSLWTISSSAT